MNMWKKYVDSPEAQARIKIGKPGPNIESFKKAHNEVHEKIKVIDGKVQIIIVYIWGDTQDSLDEFIYPHEPLDIMSSLNHGVLVIDTTQMADKKTGQLAHDMDNLKTSDLIEKYLNKDWYPSNQIVILR